MKFRPSSILRLLDPEFRHQAGRYLAQAALGGAALFIILSLEETLLARAAILAAIGSTVFVLFITPESPSTTPRHVLGGHLIALAVGGSVGLLLSTGPGSNAVERLPALFNAVAALAVAFSIFLMAATDTEHAPAAGTALGMVLHTVGWGAVAFLASSVLGLFLLQRLERRQLQDLR